MDLSVRMKHYEQESVGDKLVLRCPAILRLDGRAFHSFTKDLKSPWDETFEWLMMSSAKALCEEISTARFAYGQSDEISILLIDYENLQTQQWFGGKVQKIVSVASSFLTAHFNSSLYEISKAISNDYYPHPLGQTSDEIWQKKVGKATFDARVFSIPKDDVINYFVWRQKDAVRNSVQALGQYYFSHKELMNKNCDEIQEMLWQKHEVNWNDTPIYRKRGWSIYRTDMIDQNGFVNALFDEYIRQPNKDEIFRPAWAWDLNTPTFTQGREYIDRWI